MTDILCYMLALNVISGVTSLTVTVRRVPSQSPSYYRYPPEVYVGKSHRVTTPAPQIQERLHVVRIPKYRRKYRYRVKNIRPVAYPMVVAQRPRPPPPPPKKYHELRPLPTIVSNEVDESKDGYEEDTDFPPVSVDDGVSFPSFGKESPYQAIRKPEEWSTPSPVKGADPTFTPIQMYLQVRQTNQVKHVPQSEAVKDATTLEEVVNAPRLKELVRTTRVREVYSEEGYEDAGYDHGGHIRHAEHDEGFAARDEGVFKLKESVKDEDYTMPEASRPKPQKTPANKTKDEKIPQGVKKRNRVAEEEVAQESKLEPKISRSRSEVTSVEFATLPSTYKGEHKYSSKIRTRLQDGDGERKGTTEPPGFWSMPTVFDGLPSPTSPMNFDIFTLPSNTSDVTTQRSKYIKIIATSEEPGKAANHNSSILDTKRSRNKGLKYSRLHAKYPKRDRFRLAKLNQVIPTLETVEATPQTDDKRIILPTIGYINSLTTAHFGKNKTNHVTNNNNNNLLTTPLNLTQALNYLRSNKQHPVKTVQRKAVGDGMTMASFEAKKLKNRNRRELDDDEEDEHEEDIPDDGEEVHDEKNVEIDEEERQRLRGEDEDKEDYEKRLTEELDREEEAIVKATIGRYEPKDDSDILESLKEAYGEKTTEDVKEDVIYVTTVKPVDTSKYPFYFSRQVNADSPLRYATNPKNFPRKKGKGMVFYESREKLVHCPEVRPDLSDIPKKNTTLETEENSQSRLAGLGDKIACLRSKYFDEDPLDNPLFKEKVVDYVGRIKYKTGSATNETVRKGRDSYLPVKEKPIQEQNSIQKERVKQPEMLRYHSSYQYQPNRTLQIMVKGGQPENESQERIIPVTENVDETPLQTTAYNKITGLAPPPLRPRYTRPTYRPFITSTPPPNHAGRSKLIIPHNCMHVISKMAALDGHKNLIIDCNDAMLIQELRNDVRYLKIIPKIPEIPKKNGYARRKYPTFESTDWIPMTTYPPMSRFGRKTYRNESDHYLITELKEDEGVRRGEVVEETANGTARVDLTERPTRQRRAAQEDKKQQSPNLPLRLSLKEFFLLLQSGNGRNRFSPKPFQLPSTSPKPEESLEDEEIVKIGGQYIKGTNGREMVYIKLHPSSAGRWVVSESTPETEKYTKKLKNIYKKYEMGLNSENQASN